MREVLFWILGGLCCLSVAAMMVWIWILLQEPRVAGKEIERAYNGAWVPRVWMALGIVGFWGAAFYGFYGMLFVMSGDLAGHVRSFLSFMLATFSLPLIQRIELYALKCLERGDADKS